MISQRTIDQVLERTNIVDVIFDYVQLKKAGSNYKGCCPFHEEKTPSFIVSPAKNLWHCFGCGKGGNAIQFIIEEEGMTFPEAVRHLAKKYGIEIEDDNTPLSEEEQERYRKREALLIVLNAAKDFYFDQIHQDDPDAKAALAYVKQRWNSREKEPSKKRDDEDRDFGEIQEIGYAPKNSWTAFYDYAKAKGYSVEYMKEVGLIKEKENSPGKFYDVFHDRIMIPVKDKNGRTIAFTARAMDERNSAKYINNRDSDIFHKGETLFGLNIAAKSAISQNKVYIVEGAPDCMKLQSIGIENTVAVLGTAMTETHLNILHNLFHTTEATICFIPDSDTKPGERTGPGINAVLKNGRAAMNAGFRVTVCEIPPDEKGKKRDADSYIISKKVLESLAEKDFLAWFAEKTIDKEANTSEMTDQIKEVCSLSLLIEKEMTRQAIIDELSSIYGSKSIWKTAMKAAKADDDNEKAEKANAANDVKTYKYGFIEKGFCIFSPKNIQWSNFIMRPLFHVRDPYNSKRIYKMINYAHEEVILEMKEAEMYSLQKFRERVGSMGNYRWKAEQNELNCLGDYLYDNTDTAIEIKQLGWNPEGFFVWGNGIVNEGRFEAVDENGICRIDRTDSQGRRESVNYYLPAMSKIYSDRKDLFRFERQFIHTKEHSAISLPGYAVMMHEVFGDNAIVGLCFTIATLFRNIITSYTKNFPILNLFGPKGSGKSELGHTLMSFFIRNNTPLNIQNATIAALADAIAQCSNALVHIDEYKNSVDPVKIEFLKGLYDGTGRSRMNMDIDKKREITSVESAVILSGQEMPTVDIALFSRTIYLTFGKTVHSIDAKKKFNQLTDIRKMGVSHLTNEILKQYTKFENDFLKEYNFVSEDISKDVETNEVEDRIWRDWAVLLATYRCLYEVLELPWPYERVRAIVVDGIKVQNQECSASNELGQFWNMFENMVHSGNIFNDSDYKIKAVSSIETNIMSRSWPEERRVLMINPSNIIRQYKIEVNKMKETAMSENSIMYYLKTCPGYLGISKKNVRFKHIVKGEVVLIEKKVNGMVKMEAAAKFPKPTCFDYKVLQDKFGLNLDVMSESEADEWEQPRQQSLF